MFRNLALVALVFASAACRDDAKPPFQGVDLSMNPLTDGGDPVQTDGSTGKDASSVAYTAASAHDIDTGVVAANKPVKMTGVIATSIVAFFKAAGKTRCDYEVWVQDAGQCTTPPCGILVEVQGPPVTNNTCPKAEMSGTALATVKQGDKLDVTGLVDDFASTGPTTDMTPKMTVVQHAVQVGKQDSVTVTASNQTMPDPVVVDPAVFVTYEGSGWAKYEGTLVTLQGVTVASTDQYNNFVTTPGNANWGSTFDFLYRYTANDAGTYPTVGMHFTSITGIVATLFGGSLVARGSKDFVQ